LFISHDFYFLGNCGDYLFLYYSLLSKETKIVKRSDFDSGDLIKIKLIYYLGIFGI